MVRHDDSSRARALVALALLVLARTAVAFQFQSVAPLAPILAGRFPVGTEELGLLLGSYMMPGIFIAMLLPELERRFGPIATLTGATVLMVAGETALSLSSSIGEAVAARVLAGTGGCILYIGLINLASGLDDAGPLTRRMGLIAASWPIGNAVALVAIGSLADISASWGQAAPLAFALTALACTQVLLLLRAPGLRSSGIRHDLSLMAWRNALRRLSAVSLSFALYNTAFIVLTGFSTGLLVGTGRAPAEASAIASIPMWMFLVSVPAGGLIGDGVTRQLATVYVGCLGAMLFVLASAFWDETALFYAIAGFVGGFPTAAMLARTRQMAGSAEHMTFSVFFLIFFVTIMIVPPLIGRIASWSGDDTVVLFSISGLLAISTLFFHCAILRGRGQAGRA